MLDFPGEGFWKKQKKIQTHEVTKQIVPDFRITEKFDELMENRASSLLKTTGDWKLTGTSIESILWKRPTISGGSVFQVPNMEEIEKKMAAAWASSKSSPSSPPKKSRKYGGGFNGLTIVNPNSWEWMVLIYADNMRQEFKLTWDKRFRDKEPYKKRLLLVNLNEAAQEYWHQLMNEKWNTLVHRKLSDYSIPPYNTALSKKLDSDLKIATDWLQSETSLISTIFRQQGNSIDMKLYLVSEALWEWATLKYGWDMKADFFRMITRTDYNYTLAREISAEIYFKCKETLWKNGKPIIQMRMPPDRYTKWPKRWRVISYDSLGEYFDIHDEEAFKQIVIETYEKRLGDIMTQIKTKLDQSW
jgi:hypothetical protein